MKSLFKILIFIYITCSVNNNINAQVFLSDPSMTYVNIPTFSNRESNFSYRWNNGAYFEGTKKELLTNNQVTSTSFYGTMVYHDGSKLISNQTMGSFDSNFNPWGSFIHEINGSFTLVHFHNGQVTSRSEISKNSFSINNHRAYLRTNGGSSSTYVNPQPVNVNSYNNAGSYSNSSSSSSNYDSHYATCRGCNGTGKCHLCGGKGWKQGSGLHSSTYECSFCKGSGVCKSCHGRGKIYVGF